jgi:hypothetical protein
MGFCNSSMKKQDVEEVHEVYNSTNQDHFGLLWKILPQCETDCCCFVSLPISLFPNPLN